VLIYRQGRTDTLPGGGMLMTTNINNRTRSDPYGNELMDPRNPTWQDYTVDVFVARGRGQDYYGAFTDNTTLRIQSWMYEVPSVYPYSDTTWREGISRFLARIDSALSPAPVFFNGLGQLVSAALLPDADGGMFEGWMISNWGGYASESSWRSSQNQVLTTRRSYHKIFLAVSQAPVADTAGRLFVYGSYLMTFDDSVWFANATTYSLFAHFPEMNLCLGRPLATASGDISELRQAAGYYARAFERGVVLVNPTASSIALSGSYPANRVTVTPGTTLDGSALATVAFSGSQIGPDQALILLNAPLSSPVISNVSFTPAQPTDTGSNRVTARVTGAPPLYVEASLSALAGPAHLAMNDLGLNGDSRAGDSVFTGTFTLPLGTPATDDTVRILAFDTTGLVSMLAARASSLPQDTLNLLPNWSFEYDLDNDGVPDSWRSYGGGFAYDTAGTNAWSGRRSVRCSAAGTDSSRGVSTTVRLDQTVAEDLTLSGWSKAAGVSGTKNNDYALYVDVAYTDGTSLYGQCAQFSTGTHDWEYSAYTIRPAKPIRQLSFYCLFRSHSGEVWFDHLALRKGSAGTRGRAPAAALAGFSARCVAGGVLLRYQTAHKGVVRASVLDPSGRTVRQLVNGTQSPGSHSVFWDARNESGRAADPGIYLIRLTAAGRSTLAKTLLVR